MLLLVHMLVAADQGVLVLQLLSMLVAANQPRRMHFFASCKIRQYRLYLLFSTMLGKHLLHYQGRLLGVLQGLDFCHDQKQHHLLATMAVLEKLQLQARHLHLQCHAPLLDHHHQLLEPQPAKPLDLLDMKRSHHHSSSMLLAGGLQLQWNGPEMSWTPTCTGGVMCGVDGTGSGTHHP